MEDSTIIIFPWRVPYVSIPANLTIEMACMALPLKTPEKITDSRGWGVLPAFEPLQFSSSYVATLQEIACDPECPGHSDVGIRNLIFSLVLSLKPDAVLEIGGHIGSAAVVIGEALRLNQFGSLISLEPQTHYHEKLVKHVRMAGLEKYVQPVQGFSYEEGIFETLRKKSPFELIFLDACHDYQIVYEEIVKYRDLLSENGIMVFHDTSTHGQSFDSTKLGGVRKALLDAVSKFEDLAPIFLEYPLWLNDCGAALLCKQQISGKKSFLRKLRFS